MASRNRSFAPRRRASNVTAKAKGDLRRMDFACFAAHSDPSASSARNIAGTDVSSKQDIAAGNGSASGGRRTKSFMAFATALSLPSKSASANAAIKSALLHLNKYIVAYVNNSNFRVNSISPGGLIDGQPESFLQAYKTKTLGQGMLESKDMMGAITFLLSDNAQYINCQNIIIDDGFTI